MSRTMTKATRPDDRPTRADLAVATRERVLTAARALFERLGFEAVTIRDVVADAGLSTGSVFSSFDGKDSLFRAAFPDDHRRRRLAEGACNGFYAHNAWAAGSSGLRDRWLAVADDVLARPAIAQSVPVRRVA